jgi:predicted O-methyltransferase YrrM
MLTVEGKRVNVCKTMSLVKELEGAIIRGNRRLALEDALLLTYACADVEAKNILEIGSADGASTQVLGFAAKANDGHLWAIEPVVRQRIKDNIAHCKLEKHVTLINGQCPYVHPHEHDIKTPLDVLFIDGNHKTQWVIGDYYYWKMFVRPGGMIIFHDWCGAGGNKAEIRLALEIILKTDHVYLEEWGRSEPKDKGAIAFKVKEWIR